MSRRHAAGARLLFVIGAALAFVLVGVTWVRTQNIALPGRMLAVRVFAVPAAILALGAAVSSATAPRRASRAATAALVALGGVFAMAVRQLGVGQIEPAALVVLGGAAAVIVAGRHRLTSAPAV